MSDMVQELGTAAMLEAMEANFSEEMMCFGRVLPGGIVQEGPELWWFYTGRPQLNGVTITRLAQNDNTYIDKKITEALDFFSTRNTATHWAISPTTYPTNLATHLQARSFTKVGENITMAIDLHTMHEVLPSRPELVIKEIENLETLKIQRDISLRGFGSTQEEAQTYYDNFAANGFGKGTPWHHYIAWLNDTPVGISSLLLHAGIAGIYGVATLAEARKQGVGAALTLHAMYEARTAGYHIAILAPSQIGLHMYRTLGFQEIGMTYYYLGSQQ
ncbi:MAG: hypothetical protein NVSMB54_11300 [Ktedonobacteraceae bacterium]